MELNALYTEMGKIKIRSPKRVDLENQDQDRDLKIKIISKITYYAAY